MEEDIKLIEHYMEYYSKDYIFRKAIENLIKRNKELEEENNLIDEQVIAMNVALLESIPKSKVREKINILNTNIVNAERFDRDYIGNCRFAKYILQELLEDNENHIPRID